MSDEPAKIILGDTAITAIERAPGRRWFGRSERSTQTTDALRELRRGTHRPLLRTMRASRRRLPPLLPPCDRGCARFISELGFEVLHHNRAPDLEALAVNQRVSRRQARPLRESPAAVSARQHLVFLCRKLRSERRIRIDPTKFPEEKRAEVAAAIADKRGEIEAELNEDNLTPEQRRKAQKALDYLTKPMASATTTPTPEETPSPSAAPGASPTAESGQQKYGPVGDRPFVVFDDAKSTTPFERWIEARAKEKMGEHGTKMGLFITTLFSNLPYMMLCCIPLFALVLKVLYIRRRLFYIDHLIYALHIHTFFYAAVMLIVLATIGLTRFAPGAVAGWLIALLWIAFVTQIFLSIRYIYRQGWFFSVFKFLFWRIYVHLIVLILALAATFSPPLCCHEENILGRARHSVRAVVAFALAASPASLFCGDRHIAFETRTGCLDSQSRWHG